MITFKLGGKIVGVLGDDKIYRKDVKYSKHFFRKGNAYGITDKIVQSLREHGCVGIQLTDTEKKEIWKTSFEMFEQKSWLGQLGKFEPQKFLAKDRWDIYDFFGTDLQMAKPLGIPKPVEPKQTQGKLL